MLKEYYTFLFYKTMQNVNHIIILKFINVLKTLFYHLPGNMTRNPTNNSSGRSITLTACCWDPEKGSVETNQSEKQKQKDGGWCRYTNKLTCYHDVCGDIAGHVGVIVEGQTGIWTALVFTKTQQLQQWTCGVHRLSSERPLKPSWRTGLRWAEHGQIGSDGKGSRVISINF